ncbi:TM2 domain-containing protein [Pusillimonas sp. CC-YST705]|uniref:TM2 domain-containing protein n=1 Tax=Mesopusillimonas faecipullorum TaxID=2755040 RepID=A0ABS8C9T7_9BURK|nr:TM2 domain-containing protein [Mesopusillimonas faecipullorum]MCB5362795.1 TM2 domain-containing protein [Mesopusillimonas faecipullorum]
MLQRIVLVIAVFLILLVALSLGESVGMRTLEWVSGLTQWVVGDLREWYERIVAYIQVNHVKVLIAVLLTLPISYWLIRRPGNAPAGLSTRKMAIVLALFLGWLGAHRFYLGQIGWGLLYLVIAYLFIPLAVILGLIDALRFALMSEAAFQSRKPARPQPPVA